MSDEQQHIVMESVALKCGRVVIDAPHAAAGGATITIDGVERRDLMSLTLSMDWTSGLTSLTTTEYVPPIFEHKENL